MSEKSVHCWPISALLGDLVRGGISTASMLIMLAMTPVLSIAFFAICGLSIFFGIYLLESVSRLRSTVELDEESVRVRGGLFGAREIRWCELLQFELRHFAMSRVAKSGWMDLKLKGHKSRILLDDRLNGFEAIVQRAYSSAQAEQICLSDSTLANLEALGLFKASRP